MFKKIHMENSGYWRCRVYVRKFTTLIWNSYNKLFRQIKAFWKKREKLKRSIWSVTYAGFEIHCRWQWFFKFSLNYLKCYALTKGLLYHKHSFVVHRSNQWLRSQVGSTQTSSNGSYGCGMHKSQPLNSQKLNVITHWISFNFPRQYSTVVWW